jgi:ATP-dependent DNA helicase RecG
MFDAVQLISQGEGSSIEFKQFFDKEAIGMVVAFDYKESGDGFLVTVSYENQKVWNEAVNERSQQLLELIKKQPGVNAHELRDAINMSRSTVNRLLQELKQVIKIEFRGAPKTGGYFCCDAP